MLAVDEDPILDCDRMDLARAGAEQGDALARRGVRDDGKTVLLTPNLEQALDRYMEGLLPGMRTDGEREKSVMLAALEAIAAWSLDVFEADRQVRGAPHIVDHDCAVTRYGPEHAVAAPSKRLDQGVQIGCCEDDGQACSRSCGVRRKGCRGGMGRWHTAVVSKGARPTAARGMPRVAG
ncbi:hypothetical protein [Polyangium sp. y55x31]|uniref:hypothetical protein n=1 Tax=Polyangium sp. y55x31 TaxID=3042688 RepID=UPI002482FF7D|nr:hypothetical protein [Polyangium sp. y55x31]MDI1476320.1 hypothetical protein [Polyangium sp. y55x31]